MSRKKMQTTDTLRVPNPHGLLVPDVRMIRGEHTYIEDTVEREVNLRDDPFGQMIARNQVTKAQGRAGRQVQQDHEASGRGGRIKAQDTTVEPVDGSRGFRTVPVTDHSLAAGTRLDRYEAVLGADGWKLAAAILIDKATTREATLRCYGTVSPANLKYAGRRFRECLDALAGQMGLA